MKLKKFEPDDDMPEEPKFNVIVVGWDGTQRDHLWQCYNKELPECPDGLPNLKRLVGGDKSKIRNITITNGATVTKPGWMQILSGYNSEDTGVYSNSEYKPIPTGYTIF